MRTLRGSRAHGLGQIAGLLLGSLAPAPLAAPPASDGGSLGALAGRGGSDRRRIRSAYVQREAMVTGRPDFTLIRGPLPDFMHGQVQVQ